MSAGAGRRAALGLAPAGLLLLLTVGLPLLRVLALSFTRTELDGDVTVRFAGLDPWVRLWHDGRWWSALRNTTVFTLASVTAELALGTVFALLLHGRRTGRGASRAIVLVPWALPTAATALAWSWILNDTLGAANDLLGRAGLLASPVAWLGEPGTAMGSAILVDVWKTTPFVALIVLAGLEGLPTDVLDAARVDGLSAPARLRRVVLPLLAPALLVAGAFRGIQAFSSFDLIYVLTGGGPGGSTETVSLYAYRCWFRYLDFGYGAAAATQAGLLVLLLVVAVRSLARGAWRAS